MPEYAIVIAVLVSATWWNASREYALGNRRDAALLAGVGLLTAASAAIWLD